VLFSSKEHAPAANDARAAAGDHAGARRAAAEAAAARRDALREHAAAAAAIEAAHNRGRGLDAGTLDLHGLHIGEALAALARRHGGPVYLRRLWMSVGQDDVPTLFHGGTFGLHVPAMQARLFRRYTWESYSKYRARIDV